MRPVWRSAQWPLVWTLALAALVLGFIGFETNPPTPPAEHSWSHLDKLYMSFQLFVLESGAAPGTPHHWTLEVARWLAPAVTVYTATKAFLAIFHDQLTAMRLLFYRRHVVVCGLGQKGYLLCLAYRARGDRVVVIESDEGNDHIDGCRQAGAVVLLGDAADRVTLRKARVHRASLLFSVVADDGANAEAAGQARRLVRELGGSLTCMVHIDEVQLRDLLSEREYLTGRGDRFRMEFFNVYQDGARALLHKYPPFDDTPPERTHLLVVGLGRMGQGLVAQLAGEWHEAAFDTVGPLPVIVVDRDPDAKIDALCSRHPQVARLCRFEPWPVDVYSAEFRRADVLFDAEGRCRVTTAYICLDDDGGGLYAGLALLRRLGSKPISVVVRMMYGAGLSTLLDSDNGPRATGERYSSLHAFNLLDQTCNERLVSCILEETLAAAVHADYVCWLKESGESAETNPSIAPWDELPEALRVKNRQQAEIIEDKLELIGCGYEPLTDGGVRQFEEHEIEAMARFGHEHWYEIRRQEGWRHHEGPKDSRRRLSPNFAPWDELPEKVRESNRRAARAIPNALAAARLQVYRKSAGEAPAPQPPPRRRTNSRPPASTPTATSR